jgi:hypothetical protein
VAAYPPHPDDPTVRMDIAGGGPPPAPAPAPEIIKTPRVRNWGRPALITAVVLVLLAVTATGVYLMFRPRPVADPVAVPRPPSLPTNEPTPQVSITEDPPPSASPSPSPSTVAPKVLPSAPAKATKPANPPVAARQPSVKLDFAVACRKYVKGATGFTVQYRSQPDSAYRVFCVGPASASHKLSDDLKIADYCNSRGQGGADLIDGIWTCTGSGKAVFMDHLCGWMWGDIPGVSANDHGDPNDIRCNAPVLADFSGSNGGVTAVKACNDLGYNDAEATDPNNVNTYRCTKRT